MPQGVSDYTFCFPPRFPWKSHRKIVTTCYYSQRSCHAFLRSVPPCPLRPHMDCTVKQADVKKIGALRKKFSRAAPKKQCAAPFLPPEIKNFSPDAPFLIRLFCFCFLYIFLFLYANHLLFFQYPFSPFDPLKKNSIFLKKPLDVFKISVIIINVVCERRTTRTESRLQVRAAPWRDG